MTVFPEWLAILGAAVSFGFGVGLSWAAARWAARRNAERLRAMESWKQDVEEWKDALNEKREGAAKEISRRNEQILLDLAILRQDMALLRATVVGAREGDGMLGRLAELESRLDRLADGLPERFKEARHFRMNEYEKMIAALKEDLLDLRIQTGHQRREHRRPEGP